METKICELPEGAIVVGIIVNKEVFGKAVEKRLTDLNTSEIFGSNEVVFT